ncbi:MAG: precorrin-4 C(11)-methyltransferase [Syntrophomonadaceae bacterium]|nr:precorrin-4 C(11)-methyltransferase [Syntrophomonadaceae bacterium]
MINFVGAGPGAADLITVRGQRLLMEADVIIYAGSLVNSEHLQVAKPGCEIYDSSSMTLEEVVDVMQRAEAEGKKTVRLHSGDPSIFGAIREQMDRLDSAGIAYDLIPGVSSCFGAAASLKAEYTIPEVSQTLIITRMAGRTPVPEKEEISLLARHQASMVIFLSAGMLEPLRERLLAGGYKGSTPAALVYKATWPEEKVFRGTIDTLPQIAREQGVTKTALIVVGDCLAGPFGRSKLYDPAFSHEFRKAGEP